jgi:hypothetical protein
MLLSSYGPQKDEETGYKDDGHSGGGHKMQSSSNPNSPSSLECKNNTVTG